MNNRALGIYVVDGRNVSRKYALVGWVKGIGDEARYLRKMDDVIIIGYLWENGSIWDLASSGAWMFYFCAAR